MSIIKKTLDMYARSNAMEKTFLLDRQRTIGASEIGQCARRMFYAKTLTGPRRDAVTDEDHRDNWGARVRGTVMEDKFWIPALRARFRSKFIVYGKSQTTLHDRYLSATADGLLVDMPRDFLAPLGVPDIGPSQCVSVECKTIDPRVNLTKEKLEHELQVQVGLGLFNELTRYKPQYSLISYIDASFWDEVDEFVVKYDPATFQKMHDRAVKIKTADHAEDLKPEGWIAGGKECEWCAHTKACGIVRRSLPEREASADPQFVAEMTDMAREHEKIGEEISALEIEKRSLEDDMKNRLREKGVRKLPGVVTWFPVKGRTSVKTNDLKEAARAAGVDVSAFETTGEPTDQLRVTLSGAPQV